MDLLGNELTLMDYRTTQLTQTMKLKQRKKQKPWKTSGCWVFQPTWTGKLSEMDDMVRFRYSHQNYVCWKHDSVVLLLPDFWKRFVLKSNQSSVLELGFETFLMEIKAQAT
jgi:hypothetical protein